jgi:hypothetical protein
VPYTPRYHTGLTHIAGFFVKNLFIIAKDRFHLNLRVQQDFIGSQFSRTLNFAFDHIQSLDLLSCINQQWTRISVTEPIGLLP